MRKNAKIGTAILVLSLVALGVVFYINVNDSLFFLSNPLYGQGLGNLCSYEEECRNFCFGGNMGRCRMYCEQNPSNPLCKKLFGE